MRVAVSVAVLAIACLSLILTPSSGYEKIKSYSALEEAPESLVITGLVENQLNLTYDQLRGLPLLSEVAELQCVGVGPGGTHPSVVCNWTGVPLFCLLSMAKVIPGVHRMVVFNAVDGYSGNITLEEAMHPTTILALEANGTDLNQSNELGSGTRIVLPCRWGYKWVRWVDEIVVVDGDGSSYDEGLRPDCAMPQTEPPLQTINVTKSFSVVPTEYTVLALSNASVEYSYFSSDCRLVFSASGSQWSGAFFYVAFPRELLTKPYSVYVNQSLTDCYETDGDQNIFLYVAYTNDNPALIEIRGKYTPAILQFLGPYYTQWGAEYYSVLRPVGPVVNLISRY